MIMFFPHCVFQNVCDDKFEVKMCVEEAAIIVTGDKEPAAKCTITLTSPVMREENVLEGGKRAIYIYLYIRPCVH